MDSPNSFSCFGGLSASEIAAMQSGQSFEAAATPVVHTPGLHSANMHDDNSMISVPAYLEQGQPSGSLFDPLKKVIEQEKQQTVARPAKQKPRLQPPKQLKPKHPRQQQPYPLQQQMPYQSPTVYNRPEFQRRIARPFPFKRECIQKIFKSLLKRPDFRLPAPTKPDQVGRYAEPYYCPYHRMLGHVLEDCVQFKEWLEKGHKEGSVTIPDAYLVYPPSRSTRVVFDLTDDTTDSSDD